MPLHPQVADALEKAAAMGFPPVTDITPEEARANARIGRSSIDAEVELVGSVEDSSFPGPTGDVPIRIYRPDEDESHPLVMLFHGGGWVIGDLDAEDTTARGTCSRVNAVVVSVDYRLAPETRFPGAVEDCYEATKWAVDNSDSLGIDGSRVATTGTSAGGNLSGAVSMMARDLGGPTISHQVLFCPVIDFNFDRQSYIECAEGYGLTREAMIWFWNQYTGTGGDRSNPYAALIRASDLSGLPDATIIAAQYDPLVDEAIAYGDALKAAGVDTLSVVYDGMTHGFNNRTGIIDAAKEAMDQSAERILRSFAKV